MARTMVAVVDDHRDPVTVRGSSRPIQDIFKKGR